MKIKWVLHEVSFLFMSREGVGFSSPHKQRLPVNFPQNPSVP